MKKIFSFFTVLLCAASMMATSPTVLTFKDYNSTSGDSSAKMTASTESANGSLIDSLLNAAGFVTCTATTQCYGGRIGYGCKMGSTKATGDFTLALVEPALYDSIVVYASSYSATEGSLSINGGDAIDLTDGGVSNKVLRNIVYIPTDTVKTFSVATTAKRAFVKSITFYPKAVTPEPEPTGYTVTVTYNNMDPDTYMDDAAVYVLTDDEENPFAQLAEGENTVDAGRMLVLTAVTEGEGRQIAITVNGGTVTLDDTHMYTIASLSENLNIVFTFSNPEPEPEPEPVGSGLYVVGTMNEWTVAQAAYEMTTVTEGFEFTFDFGDINLVGQSFKITDATKSDWSDATVNLGMGTNKLNPTTAIALTHGSNTNISIADGYSSATNVVITLKYVMGEWILSATGDFEEGAAQIPDLYLRGINGDWSATEDNKLNKAADKDEWTLTLDVTDGSMFKVADATWGDYNFGGSDEEDDLELGVAYTLVSGSNVNLALPAEAAPGNYTFTLTKSEEGVWALTVVRNGIHTSLDNIELNEVRKAIENGKVVIFRNGEKYNVVGVKF